MIPTTGNTGYIYPKNQCLKPRHLLQGFERVVAHELDFAKLELDET